MPLRLISIIMVMAGLSMNVRVAGQLAPPQCLMRPDRFQIRVPRHGFSWLDGEEITGRCDDVPAKKWIRKSSGSLNLFVYADGPSGTGRYWNVTIGVERSPRSKPTRGVCLTTSTVGWRTLQRYKKSPLAWLDDLNKDGKAELILWSSFPLREDASLAEYGLMAWVYRLGSDNLLIIDWSLSRRMAREIAAAYRSAPASTTGYLAPLRIKAAEALERFADERCGDQRSEVRSQRTEVRGQRSEAEVRDRVSAAPIRRAVPCLLKWGLESFNTPTV